MRDNNRENRGVLGVKKNPKRQALFSFGRRFGDDWPSDDSEDEDYSPASKTNESTETPGAQRKRRKNKSGHGKTNVKSSSSDRIPRKRQRIDIPQIAEDKNFCSTMPNEVLFKIFQIIVLCDGSIPFLNRAQRVCHQWREVARDPMLWTSVDLSYGWVKKVPNSLLAFCETRIHKVRNLNLTGWDRLNGNSLKLIGERCPYLEHLNLTQCKKISDIGLHSLIDSCPSLTALNLSEMNPSYTMSAKSLQTVFNKCGQNLRELNLSSNKISGLNIGMLACCSNMELLDLSHVTISSDLLIFTVDEIQTFWPRLRVLKLNWLPYGSPNFQDQETAHGFEQLEELHVAVKVHELFPNIQMDLILPRLLNRSPKLRVLDVRNITVDFGTRMDSDICVTSLQYLYASRSSLAKDGSLPLILDKCRASLRELHIEWSCNDEDVNHLTLSTLAQEPLTSQLRVLNLTGNVLKVESIKLLLDGCPKLESLDLNSCRGLPRGTKRLYNGKQELKSLRKTL